MARALLPALIAASLLVTACSQAKVPVNTAPVLGVEPSTSVNVPVTQFPSDPVPPTDPAHSAQPPQSTQQPDPGTSVDVNAPAPRPPSGGGTGQKPTEPPIAVDAHLAIKWHAPDIGLPLTSEDPAAKNKKIVVLTFDDGPNPGTTEKILDVLAQNNVKAMFFITGYGMKHRDLVERIHREGHVLGPHTMTHANLTKLTVPQMRAEIEPVSKVIEEVTGEKPKYLRPPFGSYNTKVISLSQEYGMEVLTWTDGSLDWEGTKDGYKDPNSVVTEVMKQLHPGAVVLMHDTLRHTGDALPEVIKQIKAAGYEFTVLH